MCYAADDQVETETLCNSRNGVTPFVIRSMNGSEMTHIDWQGDSREPWHIPHVGTRVFMDATIEDVRTPLAEALANERAQAVRAGLRRLRPLDRETLEAFYVRGQSLIEMADEFDAPIGTIKRRLHVARKRLASELATCSAI